MKKEKEIKKPEFKFTIQDMVNAKNKALKVQEINSLKKQLEQGDYKIIKCYEATLTNKPLPYDIETLTKERDAIRLQINELENELI